jgi:uncharacterized integral membrane protein
MWSFHFCFLCNCSAPVSTAHVSFCHYSGISFVNSDGEWKRVLNRDFCLMLVICGIIFAVINKKTVKINYLFLVFCVVRMFLKWKFKAMIGCIAVCLFKNSAVLYFILSAIVLSFHQFLSVFYFLERWETVLGIVLNIIMRMDYDFNLTLSLLMSYIYNILYIYICSF